MTDVFINFIKELVKIPSPSGEEAAASRYLSNWLAQNGFNAWVDEAGNAVGTKGDGPKEIMLLGHIDTFPGNPPVRQEGNLLYGRGSVDAKGPLCTFAAAASQVEVPSGWRLTVVGAVEEECATSKGARYMLTQREGKPPHYCVIGEPSHWDRITLGYKGRLLLQLGLHLPFSHSAGQGTLPAEQGVNIWQAIENYAAKINEGRKGAFNRLDPSLRAINSQDEGAFGTVEMSLGFRLPLDIDPHTLEAELRALIHNQASLKDIISDETPQEKPISLHFEGHEHAYKAKKSTPLVRAFLKAIRAKQGKPRFVVKTGTADMNIVGPIWQCPILAYGPGDSSLDHTPQEHLDLEEYLQAIAVLKIALEEMMQVASGR